MKTCHTLFMLLLASSFLTVPSILINNYSAQTLCENGFADIYPCSGYDLYTHFPLSAVGGGENGNDCWGWVDDVSGREFVLYGRSHGISVVEVTDPLAPSFIATLPTASVPSLWRDIKVIGNYAFIVSEASQHGMQVLELTQLLDLSGFPFNLSSTSNYLEFGNAHNIAVNTETNFAYAVGTNTFNGGLHIIDVSNPELPVIAGSFSDFYSHDVQPVVYNGLDIDYQGMEIVFCFNGASGIAIVNANDKNDVQLIKQVNYPESFYTHQGWVSDDHKFLYFNDELDELNNGNNTRTYIMNIDDLDNPVIVGFYEADNTSIDHNLYTHNGRIYASNYRSGLRVSTILNDGTIQPQGFFDTYPADDAAAFDGTWSNYPYFPSGTIAVSNFDGLFIIKESVNSVETVESSKYSELRLLPNPAASSVQLSGDFYNCDIKIYDILGREVLNIPAIPTINGLNIDVSSLNGGTYLVNVIDSSTGMISATNRLIVSPK